MSIKKKIVLSFVISALIIASLIGFEYINYVEMRSEIRFLELTDTIRSNTLQLRRHEKNYFLFSPQMSEEETIAIQDYVERLRRIIDENLPKDRTGRFLDLDNLLDQYSVRFEKIREGIKRLNGLLDTTVPADRETRRYYPLIELTFMERPLDSAVFLEGAFGLPHNHPLVKGLRELDSDIKHLRKNGEDIIAISKELDKIARDKVEHTIGVSQKAILVFFPLFLVIGTGTLFLIAGDVTMRLRALTEVVETTGRGEFNHPPYMFRKQGMKDELGVLAEKFSEMGSQLMQREQELSKKNEELLQTKKLAAIGTLASGVAHELNNPLNNIYISAQVLKKHTGADSPAEVREVVDDIVGQTARVKRIVGDLLEFARMKEPELKPVEICGMLRRAYGLVSSASLYRPGEVKFSLECPEEEVFVDVDPDQMDRVFINIMTNAVDAMGGHGALSVKVGVDEGSASVTVEDTGPGIEPSLLDKLFEPFYTTKERGTGLGLSIAYNIVRRHGGDISVTSEVGKGTAFTVRLPRGKA